MRPRRSLLAVGVLLVALCALGLGAAQAAKPAPAPTRLLVRGEEFNLLLSQLKLNPGNAIVQLVNAGEDPHDLQIQRLGDSERFSIPELPAGEIGEVGLRFQRDSNYVLWCSLPSHRQLGMEANVRVRRKKR